MVHQPQDHPDFIGWHCQGKPRAPIEHEDTIGYNYRRVDVWLHTAVNLPPDLKQRFLRDAKRYLLVNLALNPKEVAAQIHKLKRLLEGHVELPQGGEAHFTESPAYHVLKPWVGVLTPDWDDAPGEYNHGFLPDWFDLVGLKWIWVTEDKPVWGQGGNKYHRFPCYGVFLDKAAIVLKQWDWMMTGYGDDNYVYIYDSNVAIPQVIPTNREAHTIWGNPPRRSR